MARSSRVVASDPEYSRQWMEQFAIEMGTTMATVLNHAENWLNNGEVWDEGIDFLNLSTPDEFWIHYKAITGRDGDGDFITCTC